MSAAAYFQQNPDVAAAYSQNTYGLTPEQFAQAHYERYGQAEQRVSPTGAPAVTTTTAPSGGTTARTTLIPYFQQNPDVAASYAANNYGMTPEQFAAYHFANYGVGEQRVAPTTSPFANATQGFANNFNNYTSIPIGAQYNPGVVGGTGSPYRQIMSQMRPVGNPYIGVASNQPMGGYDPTIYDSNLLSNFVADRAAEMAGAAVPAGAETTYGGYNGGLITKVMGPNPSTPDDGTMFVQKGEYIIKRDSVDKYGKGLLDMINEGKIPAKKIKSLLD